MHQSNMPFEPLKSILAMYPIVGRFFVEAGVHPNRLGCWDDLRENLISAERIVDLTQTMEGASTEDRLILAMVFLMSDHWHLADSIIPEFSFKILAECDQETTRAIADLIKSG